MTIDEMLAAARDRLHRLGPAETAAAVAEGAQLVDIRPGWQRAAEGAIPGALLIERNHLEWRLDPTSDARIPEAVHSGIRWILICEGGFSSSLAADALHKIGLRRSTDIIGGFHAWTAAGLPVERPDSPATPRKPGEGAPTPV